MWIQFQSKRYICVTCLWAPGLRVGSGQEEKLDQPSHDHNQAPNMNVLVYSGPEVVQSSLTSVISSLRSILVPNYTVQPLTQQALTSHPWAPACALLVLPACDPLQSETGIKAYLENGGPLLAFSVGARGPRNLLSSLSDLTVSADQLIRINDKSTGDYISMQLQQENGTNPVDVETDGERVDGVPCNSSQPAFLELENKKSVKVMGRFTDGTVAGIKHGNAVLWAPDFGRDLPPHTETRLKILRNSLRECGLHVPSDISAQKTPLPQILVGKPPVVGRILKELSAESSTKETFIFKDENDTFHLHPSESCASLLADDTPTSQPKHIIVYADGSFPTKTQTSMFDIEMYFEELAKARGEGSTSETWGIGEALLYGEAVTSTQTMLDK